MGKIAKTHGRRSTNASGNLLIMTEKKKIANFKFEHRLNNKRSFLRG